MNNLDLYCVTNKKLEFLENTDLKLVAVGKEKFDLMTGGGGDNKNRSLEARGLRSLALKK